MQEKNRCLKVGILSDSHGQDTLLQEAIDKLKQEGAKYLLHLGDFQTPKNLEVLANANLPYAAVFGNNDRALIPYAKDFHIFSEPHYLKIKDTTFKLMHHPFYFTPDVDVILYGHLHKFAFELHHGKLFLNPGEVCARNKPLCEAVLLEISKDTFIINYFAKNVETKSFWEQKKFEQKRV